jgi:AAA domain
VSDIVTAPAFAAIEEPGAEALVGDPDAPLVPQDGGVVVYGDGGAGKTTLVVDLAFHLAAGLDWLGIPVGRKLRVLIIENEGPRAHFRTKLRRKLDAWQGPPIDDRILVWEDPWATFTFANEDWRVELSEEIYKRKIDVVIIGPVTASGMLEAGTLQEVREFYGLVREVQCAQISIEGGGLSERQLVTFVLVHHENKAGQVSGAWEGVCDTLLHVQAQGHGRTRLHIQKARWASDWHKQTLNLTWADGDSFVVDDQAELDDDTLAEQILAAISQNPGISWTKVEQATRGVGKERRRAVRDGLFTADRILNVVKKDGVETALRACPERQAARLYLADDPVVQHLRPDSGAGAAQSAPTTGADPAAALRRAPALIGRTGVGAAADAPDPTHNGHADDDYLDSLARTQQALERERAEGLA